MKIDSDAADVLAQVISSGDLPTVELDADAAEEVWCGVCADYVALRIPMHTMSTSGVHSVGTVTTCPIHETFDD